MAGASRRARLGWRRHAAPGVLALTLAIAAPAAATDLFFPPATTPDSSPVAEQAALAVDAYVYAYPLVLMELTRRVQTNVGDGAPAPGKASGAGPRAAMNQFAHQRALPDPMSIESQRPNADVLTSSLWFDVGTEPLVITIPAAGGRWYSMPIFDLWSDVFAAPGPRTTGDGLQHWALTKAGWSGMLPEGVGRLEAPTETGRVILRIRTDGPADYPTVHAFQDGLKGVPLGYFGKEWTAPPGTFDPARAMQPPADQILRLSTTQFFDLFTTLTARNPPHPNDYPILHRMARLGLVPGRPFAQDRLAPEVRAVLEHTPITAGQRLFESFKKSGARANGWRILLSPMGTYGTDYRRRQVVAFTAFGADLSEDVFFLTTIADGDGKPLESTQRYTVHFTPEQLPPVHAFWSLSVYDERHLIAPKRQRATIGDRDTLTKNPDGSLDLHLQQNPPGGAKNANWLPTPLEGRFTLVLRLYWPKAPALDGTWIPPPVVRIAEGK